MKEISLGRSMEESMPEPNSPREHFPCLYLDGGKELAGLPDEGTMTIRYKIASRTHNERDGKKTSSVSIDVTHIVDVEGEKAKESSNKSREAELDKLAEEESKGSKDDDGDEY